MKAEIIQYLLPNGRLRKMYVDLPDENKSKYIEMTIPKSIIKNRKYLSEKNAGSDGTSI